ncbi:MAG TPA: hypothetical protein VER03_03335, partial [Bryobacteraceae bacterium]|nr:hypothetical protein [Bryobacteraceae bacterium]
MVYVQALSQEGQVRLVLTSSEFQGEFPLTVTLEPSVVRWGLRTFQGGQQVLSDDITLALGYQPTEISLVAAGESGSFGNIRPGVSPPTLTVSNSAPRVVEVSRVTLQLPTSLKIGGRAAGQAELSLTAAPGTMRVANRSLRVRVQDSATSRLTLPGPIVVGKDLQCVSSIGYDGHSLITITSSDPSALLLATTAQDRGSPEITLVPDTRGGPYTFYCSALKSLGEVRLSVRVAGETDREIKVTLTTSGVAIRAYNGATASGYQGAAQVYTAAVDEQSGVAVSAQKLQPGIMMPVRLRTEGASIRLAPDTFELSNEKDTGIFYFTNPEAGAESTIVAESGSGFAQARVSGRMRLRLNDSPTPPLTGRTRLPMMRDQLYELTFSIAAPAGTTITSSDPDKLVLSETQSSATGRSIQLAATASGIFLHALSESGSAMLRVEAPGHPTSELAVLFRPIAVVVNDVTLTKGGTGRLTPSLGVSALRPGVGPIRLNMRTADPAIATIKPAVVELTPYAPEIEVIGHSEGQTEIILEAPAGVSVTPASVIVENQIPALVSGDIYRLGKNLQSSVELTVPQALRSENASILSISSSDPGRVLLSRSESGPGSPSINVALSAGAPATPRIFSHALDAEGETTLKATTAGVSQDLAVIRVVPSWLACNRSNQTLVLTRGQTSTYECYFAVPYYAETRTPPAVTLSGQPRSGSQILWPEITSTAPDIAAVKTVPDPVLTDRLIFQVTAVAVGEAELRVNQPAGFGPVADYSDVQPVRVEAPRLSASCGESDLAKRLQRTCTVTSQGGAQLAASAISGDPSLLSVKPGLVANSFILEALASAGTAEVLFTAPGYTDLRSAIVLRPVQVYIPPATATLRVGQTGSLSINTQGGAAAAGSDIAVTVTATPEGVIALEPARLRFEAGQSSTSLTIRGVSAGTAVLRF